MKNFLFALIAIFAFATAQAQTAKTGFSKADTFVEGTVKFVTSDDVKTFNFNPSVGYFVTDTFAVGVNVNTQSTKTAGVKHLTHSELEYLEDVTFSTLVRTSKLIHS